MFISVMMTYWNAESSAWKKERPLKLEAYRLNLSTALAMKQVDSKFATCEGVEGPFETPLVRIDFPAMSSDDEITSVYVSGVLDDIESRFRGAVQSNI